MLFRIPVIRVLDSAEKLLELGWIKQKELSNFSLKGLGMKDFVKDLIKSYEKRHNTLNSLK